MIKIDSNVRAVIFAIAVTSCVPGCKATSGWKMPGMGLFSSSREPDAATLVGTDDVRMPESPASKYSPGTIAAVGAQTNPSFGNTSKPGNVGAYGYTAQTVSTPKAGLAATANGYQTGPYDLGSATKNSTMPNMGSKSSFPSPYGGTYTGTSATTQTPDIALPRSAADTLASATAGSAYPSAPSTGNAVSGAQNNLQVGYPLGGNGAATGAAGLPAFPAGLTSGLPSYPSIPSPTSLPGGTSATSGQPQSSAYNGSTTLSSTTVGGGASGGTFSPGTTGRSTKYNFGSGATTGANTLPPNTASGANSLLR